MLNSRIHLGFGQSSGPRALSVDRACRLSCEGHCAVGPADTLESGILCGKSRSLLAVPEEPRRRRRRQPVGPHGPPAPRGDSLRGSPRACSRSDWPDEALGSRELCPTLCDRVRIVPGRNFPRLSTPAAASLSVPSILSHVAGRPVRWCHWPGGSGRMHEPGRHESWMDAGARGRSPPISRGPARDRQGCLRSGRDLTLMRLSLRTTARSEYEPKSGLSWRVDRGSGPSNTTTSRSCRNSRPSYGRRSI